MADAPETYRTIQRAADRGFWEGEGIVTRQSFPALGNFDQAANAHGLLVMNNDDLVEPGSGVDRHQHHDVEIVTWVVAGEVHHDDSSGASGVLRAGQVQAMSAGAGITHREQNPRSTRTVSRVIQMWLPPNSLGATPRYASADVAGALAGGDPIVVASGIAGHSPLLSIDNDAAALWAARLGPGQSATVPGAPYGHLFIVRGTVNVDVPGEVGRGSETGPAPLTEGDSLRTRNLGPLQIRASESAEVLYWEMRARAVSRG